MMLTDLQPQFLKYAPTEGEWTERQSDGTDKKVTGTIHCHNYVHQLDKADGIVFLCPVCYALSLQKPDKVHSVVCWFTGKVPPELTPKPGRWNPSGTGYNDLTFVEPGPTSILIKGGCDAHFFIRNGEVINA